LPHPSVVRPSRSSCNRLAIRNKANVKLDPKANECLCRAQAGEGVFGRASSSAAVADHRRKMELGFDRFLEKGTPT
jgi:hypothetical protein